MNKKEIISEISRMKSLFGYKKGVVLSEQTTENQKKALQLGFGPVSVQKADELASQGKLASATNTYQLPGTMLNNAMGQSQANAVANQQAAQKTQEERINNIANIYSRADAQGVIKFPGNQHDGMTWSKYVSTYQITQDEINSAKQKAAAMQKEQPAAPQFVAEKFPLKYMMQGENVKKLQQALGVKTKSGQPNISGKFYNATQTALDLKAKELGIAYDRNKGLDETSFNEIIQAAQPKRELEKAVPVAARTETPNLTNISPTLPANIKAPQIQPIQTQLTLDQQFQVAKANLDAAKAELDAAQKTDDRVAIGTARGKQQAARQEVRRLRGELAAQNQPQ
jgi:hypothetical protein